MCLYSKQLKPLKAKKDIIVYKALITSTGPTVRSVIGTRVFNVAEVILRASNHNFVYEIGKLYSATLNRKTPYNVTLSRKSQIEEGFHAYTCSPKQVRKIEGIHKVIVECVIPKGSSYYVGTNNGSSPGIVSSNIKVVKIVD